MGRLHGPVVGGVVQIDQRVKFRKEVQSGLFYPWSNVWYVDPTDGNDGYDGRGPSTSKSTLAAAVAAMAAGDIIYLRPGTTDHVLSAALTMSLNDIQVIGTHQNQFQPHCDISMADATQFDPMITISGRGGYFANFVVEHGSRVASGEGYAADLTACTISGRYNFFDNVYFYTPFYPEQDVVDTYKGVQVTGHNNFFKNCKFGSDGRERDKVNWNLVVAGVGNIFEDCIFQTAIANTTPQFVWINNTAMDMKYALFRRCTFYAHSAGYANAMATAFKTDFVGGNTAAAILEDCNFVNVSKVASAAQDGNIWKSTPGDTAAAVATHIAVANKGT